MSGALIQLMQTDNKKSGLSRDILAYVPIKLMPAITGLLGIIILARNLAPEEYGRYSVVITTALLLVQLAGSWISSSVLYLFPEYSDEKNRSEFRRQTINLQLLISLPASGIAYAAIYMVTHIQQLALVGGLLVFFQLLQGLLMTFLQSARNIYTQTISVAIQCIFQVGSLCILIFVVNGKEAAAVVSVVIGFIAGNIILFFANKKLKIEISGTHKIISRELLLKMAAYGLPMCLWFFSTQFYMIGDRIFLQFYGVSEQLGQYASFRDLATGCAGFLTMPLVMASHPIIMAKWKSKCDPREIEAILSGNIVFLSMLFIPLIVMTDIVGRDLITAMFGQRYFLPESIMLLVVTSIFLGSVSIHLQKGLEVTGQTSKMAKISLVTAIFNAVGNIIAIPKFGVLGGAVMVFISGVLYLILIIISVRNILLPRIALKFFIKLIVWALVTEITLRFTQTFTQLYLDKLTITIFNFLCIMIAALILVLSDKKIRQFVMLRLGSHSH